MKNEITLNSSLASVPNSFFPASFQIVTLRPPVWSYNTALNRYLKKKMEIKEFSLNFLEFLPIWNCFFGSKGITLKTSKYLTISIPFCCHFVIGITTWVTELAERNRTTTHKSIFISLKTVKCEI